MRIYLVPKLINHLKEFSRVLKPSGILLLREPIVSMGDWRKKRIGLTKRERGIPLNILRKNIKENFLDIISEKNVLFPITRRLNLGEWDAGNSKFFVLLDYIFGLLFSWNSRYHANDILHKIRPQSIFYVLRKK